MREVTSNADTGASTVRDTTLTLVKHSLREIAEPYASADFSNEGGVVECDLLHGLEIDHCTQY
jgi:hypothetical protein